MTNGSGRLTLREKLAQAQEASRTGREARGGAPVTSVAAPSPVSEPKDEGPGFFSRLGGGIKSGVSTGLRGMMKGFDFITTPGQLGSLYLTTYLRRMGVGSHANRLRQDKMLREAQSLGGFRVIGALKQVQREREAFFFGEKILTEVVTDPLSLVGFGFLGKIPLAGRALGPMEHAYIRGVGATFAAPFRGIAAVSRRLPQPAVFRTTALNQETINMGKNAFEEFGNDQIKNMLDPAVTDDFINVMLTTPEKDLPDSMRNVLNVVRRDTILPDELRELAQLAGMKLTKKQLADLSGEVAEAATTGLKKGMLRRIKKSKGALEGDDMTAETLSGLEDMVEKALEGQIDRKVAEAHVIKALGMSQLDEAGTELVETIMNGAMGRVSGIVRSLRSEIPEVAVRRIARRNANIEEKLIKQEIATVRMNHGVVSKALDNILDPAYNAVWRGRLEVLSGAFAESVLTFANFGFFNYLENAFMVLSGGSKLHHLDAFDYADVFRGEDVITDLLTTGSGKRAAEATTTAAGVLGKPRPGQMHFPLMEDEQMLGKLRTMFAGRSADLKRGTHWNSYSKNLKKILGEMSPEDTGALLTRVEDLSKNIPNPWRDHVLNATRKAAASGDPEEVMGVMKLFTARRVTQKEVAHAVSKADMLPPWDRQQYLNVRTEEQLVQVEKATAARFEKGLQEGPAYMSARVDRFTQSLRNTPLETAEDVAAAHNHFMNMAEQVPITIQSMKQAARAGRRDLMEQGVRLGVAGRKVFANLYEELGDIPNIIDKQLGDALTELHAAAARVGVPPQRLKSHFGAVRAKQVAWADWHRTDKAAHDLHFQLHGRNPRAAEMWVEQSEAAYNAFIPRINELNKAFQTENADFAALIFSRGSLPIDDFTSVTREMMERYNDPPGGVLRDPRFDDQWNKFRNQQSQIGHEIRQVFKDAPFSTPEQQAGLRTYLEGVAEEARRAPKDRMRVAKDRALKLANAEVDRAFINYNDMTTFDYVARHIYPFFMYESRVWERLARLGFQHPVAMATFGPEGTYWRESDDGYFPFPGMPIQVMPTRGTMIGRLRRAYRRNYPNYEEGAYGKLLDFNDTLERYGFYAGLHITAPATLTARTLVDQEDLRLGEFMPPAYETAVNVLIAGGAAADVPGIENLNRFFGSSRFKDREVNLFLWNKGIIPSEADEGQRRDALKWMSLFKAAEAQMSLTRYRPESWEDYIQAKKEADALVRGMTMEEVEAIFERGQSLNEVKPLTPQMRQMRRRFIEENLAATYDPERIDQFMDGYEQVNRPLRNKEEREKARRLQLFWNEWGDMREGQIASQGTEDARRLQGGTTGFTWRKRRGLHSAARTAVFPAALASAGLTEEDIREDNPSGVDLAMRDFFGVDIAEFTDEATGDIDWKNFFAAQERTLSGYDRITRAETREWLGHNLTEFEQLYRRGYDKGYGDWFDKRAAAEWHIGRVGRRDIIERALARVESSAKEEAELMARKAKGLPVSSLQLALASKRTSAHRFIERMQKSYRKDLLQNSPDLEEWLFWFFDRDMK
ncbi:hypothetical protein CMI37_33150 [Candidatus Pacearchaeota archaeon]|nr:hypothetical protein [Candidatus Pacearchaeota archaeon]